MIIYTCPKCGADLQEYTLTSNPPQSHYNCPLCGWSYTEPNKQPEEIIRISFGGNSQIFNGYLSDSFWSNDVCATCPNDPRNGGSGNCNCILGQPKITY